MDADNRYLTRKAFAESQGWSPPYITKLGHAGRLVLAPDGERVDVQATLELIAATEDPTRDSTRERHARARTERDVGRHTRPDAPDLDPPPQEPKAGHTTNFQAARAKREHFLAELAETEYRQKCGQLVERERVERAAHKVGRMLRETLLGLPVQLAPDLAPMTDPWEVERRLTEALRTVLDDIARMGADDLDAAL